MTPLYKRGLALRLSKGFTLIELLVVIAIIGLLASVVLASLNSARKKGRDARRIADLKQVQLALELYFDSNGQSYPNATTWSALGTALASTYIAVLPNDPSLGSTSYGYVPLPSGCTTSCTGYYLGGILENVGQTGALTSDNDTGQVITINGAATNCSAAATSGTEAVYCIGS